MNNTIRSAVASSRGPCAHLRAAFFHSTPVLERKRRNHWESRSNYNTRRFRKMQSKQSLLRNVNAYADFLFKRWEEEADEDDPFSSRSSWFGNHFNKGSQRQRKGKRSNQRWGGNFQFCEEEIDVETIFRSAFGGTRCFYWSFVEDENPHSHWRSWTRQSNDHRGYRYWRDCSDDEYEFSPESDSSELQLASDRVALGLSTSGPLKLEDVKNAYRACALKWHPDRHQGSSKAVAEEKFKLCSAAYQSLCDKLAVE
ncbi:uncharacterized protein LOC116196044 isoform X2 [Punica granatum]|uniref:Uncharacterized protein LOC116196044 isoform X2 n=1 Tax=Punica granatum TaxID=22663 RepID=A0A6P8CJ44_PUNGR|nr:uncharacterized protein LOC116196044 isoform X2 [Punica granatum]